VIGLLLARAGGQRWEPAVEGEAILELEKL
jgi:hypothetical protein